QHRVYQVFLPQTYGLLAHERVNALIESLTTLRDAMSEKVLVAESFGFDASDVNTALGSAAADLAQATGEIQSARLLLETMSNDDVSTAHDHFASARDHLHSARELVKGAHSSLRQAAAWLKDFAAGR
ncbi:MAG: hypothetical protein Q8P95_05545, partial [bacterium]|nr:hypothetical protein [bacterium]